MLQRALIVVDVQQGFDDLTYWGTRNNRTCEPNVARLMDTWRRAGQPIVRVRHDSAEPESPLRPGQPGNALQPEAEGPADLDIRKTVHSSFHGDPDLARWLDGHGVSAIAVCGITTNMCCETTARVGSDLGFDTWFVLDATHGFDLMGVDGSIVTADQLARSTAAILAADFATVLSTDTAIAEISSPESRLLGAPPTKTSALARPGDGACQVG